MNSKIEWEQETRRRCEADLLPVHSLETSSSLPQTAAKTVRVVQTGGSSRWPSREDSAAPGPEPLPDSETGSIECDKIGVT